MSLIENRVLTLDQAQPGTGPIAPVLDVKHNPRPETYLNLDNNIRSKVDNNFVPIINAQDESAQQYVNTSYVNFTGREQISPTVVEQINAQREKDGSNWWRYEDTPRTTTNEQLIFPMLVMLNEIKMGQIGGDMKILLEPQQMKLLTIHMPVMLKEIRMDQIGGDMKIHLEQQQMKQLFIHIQEMRKEIEMEL